ncbi:MAG: putative Fe-S cluster assembly protein SufT [Thermoplasmatota archaeon]
MNADSLQIVELARDVAATIIPDGTPVTLPAGTTVRITQALGGSYTIQLERGGKYRIEGRDADAIGQEPTEAPAEPTADAVDPATLDEGQLRDAAWKAMRGVHDPEIPVNIVELGLVYELHLHRRGDGFYFAEVKMTLTAPGCGMGDVLVRDVQNALTAIPGIETATAEIVFDPVWNPHNMMSEAAKLQLGLL